MHRACLKDPVKPDLKSILPPSLVFSFLRDFILFLFDISTALILVISVKAEV